MRTTNENDELRALERTRITSLRSDWWALDSPEQVGRTHTRQGAHIAVARVLLSQSLFRPSSIHGSSARSSHFPAVPARSAFAAIHTPPVSVCKRSFHSRRTSRVQTASPQARQP